MKCPVCKNEVNDILDECDVCGFSELQKTFINIEDAKLWEEKVVFPLRAIWISSQNMHKLVVSKYEKKKKEYDELVKKYKGLERDYTDLKATFSTLKELSPAVTPSIDNPTPGWSTKNKITYPNFSTCKYQNYSKGEVSNISIEFDNNRNIIIKFLVKKIFDYNGDQAITNVKFRWRIKNSKGVVIKSNEWCGSNLMLNDVVEGSITFWKSECQQTEDYVFDIIDC